MKPYSKRMEAVPASKIRKIFNMVLEDKDIISFAVGEPDFDTPSNIVKAAVDKLEHGATRYGANVGLLELREAVAKKFSEERGLALSTENVMITAGAMQGIYMTMQAILEEGDEIIIGSPYFSNYAAQAAMCGAKLVTVDLSEENGFILTPQLLESAITPKTKMVLLNSPSNPLGSVIDKQTLSELAEVIKKYDLYAISDEVYRDFIYDNDVKPYSIGAFEGMAERTITIDSFSKSYAMTGWRIGIVCANEELIRLMTKMQEGMVACVNTALQYGALEALTGPQDDKKHMISVYKKRRDLLCSGINNIDGLSCRVPQGAFYLFVNIKDTGLSSEEFAVRLIKEAKVAVIPGDGFGSAGEGYVRLSYVISEDDIKKALIRIEKFVKDLKAG